MNSKLASCLLLSICLFAVSMTGCTSFRSTIMHRNDRDQVYPQFAPRVSRGVPVRLKIPSHMEVIVYESYQVVPGIKRGSTIEPPKIWQLNPTGNETVMEVETNLEYTEKVFTVDFPRPFSGSLALGGDSDEGLVFDGEQYFASVNGSIDDDTLEDINTIVSDQLSKLAGTKSKAKTTSSASRPDSVGDDEQVDIQRRVVAYKRFDINACGWEKDVQDFIDEHLNFCHPACCDQQQKSCGDAPAVDSCQEGVITPAVNYDEKVGFQSN